MTINYIFYIHSNYFLKYYIIILNINIEFRCTFILQLIVACDVAYNVAVAHRIDSNNVLHYRFKAINLWKLHENCIRYVH